MESFPRRQGRTAADRWRERRQAEPQDRSVRAGKASALRQSTVLQLACKCDVREPQGSSRTCPVLNVHYLFLHPGSYGRPQTAVQSVPRSSPHSAGGTRRHFKQRCQPFTCSSVGRPGGLQGPVEASSGAHGSSGLRNTESNPTPSSWSSRAAVTCWR